MHAILVTGVAVVLLVALGIGSLVTIVNDYLEVEEDASAELTATGVGRRERASDRRHFQTVARTSKTTSSGCASYEEAQATFPPSQSRQVTLR